MKKFPQIKWYQTKNEVVICILEKGDNYNIQQNNNFFIYKDDIYDFEIELFDSFTIDRTSIQRNNLNIILNKNNNKNNDKNDIIDDKNSNEWNSLLKNNKLYKYFISLNWDKFIDVNKSKNILTEETNGNNSNLFDEDEFNYLLKSGELDNISSDSDSE